MSYANVLLKPVVSEKATFVKELANQVAFYVAPEANKIDVRRAVEDAFSVKVQAVRIVRRRPLKRRRFGRVTGHLPGFKKAYVTLAEGDKIEFFEGV